MTNEEMMRPCTLWDETFAELYNTDGIWWVTTLEVLASMPDDAKLVGLYENNSQLSRIEFPEKCGDEWVWLASDGCGGQEEVSILNWKIKPADQKTADYLLQFTLDGKRKETV
jgi:hypothetical protein